MQEPKGKTTTSKNRVPGTESSEFWLSTDGEIFN